MVVDWLVSCGDWLKGYDHWNRSQYYTPSGDSVKWYHYDEPSIMDVTSYDDIVKAMEDGRMKKIAEEHEKYEKEHEG